MGRSNLTVVKEAGKNPTPWKEPAGRFARGGAIGRESVMGRHPAGSGLFADTAAELLKKLQENRNDSIRARLRNMQAQAIAELDSEKQGMLKQHETETLLLDYRLAGNTLEGLGELGDDEVVEAAWARLTEDFEL